MIEEKVERMRGLFLRSPIYMISEGALARLVWSYVPELPEKNILVEPEGRSMAASLILGTAIIYLKDPSAVVAALRADVVNLNKERFLRKFKALEELAARGRHSLPLAFRRHILRPSSITFKSYQPRPENLAGEKFYRVLRFKEKLGLRQSKRFVADR
ncbi:MAG: hypothetical protein ACUVR0_11975 [Candidatus Aminicenantales bacterium]